MIIKENNNKRKFIKERTKGDYVLDRKDIFGDEDSITEARQMHTWSVTYNGRGNKVKTHMVDAPDAYEANRKARRELGISYNDIEDVTMVENKSIDESIENDYGETLYRFIVGNGTSTPSETPGEDPVIVRSNAFSVSKEGNVIMAGKELVMTGDDDQQYVLKIVGGLLTVSLRSQS